ncbi:hypothetical protein R3I94_017862 [Phoxinus phoxinus]
MEIHQSAVILLLVLCVSFSAHAQEPPPYVRDRYLKFLNQHRGPFVNVEMCTSEISKRNITAPDGGCKPVNTFIKAFTDYIDPVCGGGKYSKLYRSNQPFNVVTCTLEPEPKYPNCTYTGKLSTQYIVLGCIRGWPVHYEGQ